MSPENKNNPIVIPESPSAAVPAELAPVQPEQGRNMLRNAAMGAAAIALTYMGSRGHIPGGEKLVEAASVPPIVGKALSSLRSIGSKLGSGAVKGGKYLKWGTLDLGGTAKREVGAKVYGFAVIGGGMAVRSVVRGTKRGAKSSTELLGLQTSKTRKGRAHKSAEKAHRQSIDNEPELRDHMDRGRTTLQLNDLRGDQRYGQSDRARRKARNREREASKKRATAIEETVLAGRLEEAHSMGPNGEPLVKKASSTLQESLQVDDRGLYLETWQGEGKPLRRLYVDFSEVKPEDLAKSLRFSAKNGKDRVVPISDAEPYYIQDGMKLLEVKPDAVTGRPVMQEIDLKTTTLPVKVQPGQIMKTHHVPKTRKVMGLKPDGLIGEIEESYLEPVHIMSPTIYTMPEANGKQAAVTQVENLPDTVHFHTRGTHASEIMTLEHEKKHSQYTGGLDFTNANAKDFRPSLSGFRGSRVDEHDSSKIIEGDRVFLRDEHDPDIAVRLRVKPIETKSSYKYVGGKGELYLRSDDQLDGLPVVQVSTDKKGKRVLFVQEDNVSGFVLAQQENGEPYVNARGQIIKSSLQSREIFDEVYSRKTHSPAEIKQARAILHQYEHAMHEVSHLMHDLDSQTRGADERSKDLVERPKARAHEQRVNYARFRRAEKRIERERAQRIADASSATITRRGNRKAQRVVRKKQRVKRWGDFAAKRPS